jgi:hypothetical protein
MMNTVQVTLSAEEHDLLLRLLQTALGDTRVEVHHTHYSPSFREGVKHEEALIRSLLEKIKQSEALKA